MILQCTGNSTFWGEDENGTVLFHSVIYNSVDWTHRGLADCPVPLNRDAHGHEDGGGQGDARHGVQHPVQQTCKETRGTAHYTTRLETWDIPHCTVNTGMSSEPLGIPSGTCLYMSVLSVLSVYNSICSMYMYLEKSRAWIWGWNWKTDGRTALWQLLQIPLR